MRNKPTIYELYHAAIQIKGTTAKQYCKRFGITRRQMHNILKGDSNNPNVEEKVLRFIQKQISKANDYLKQNPKTNVNQSQ